MYLEHQLTLARGVDVILLTGKQTLVAIRPITDLLGLDWAAQFTKLKAQPDRFSVAMIATVTPKGERAMVALPAHQVTHWLWSINVTKVAEAARETLQILRARLGDALEAFERQVADRLRLDVTRLTALLTTRAPAYSALIQAARAGATDEQMMRMSSRPRWKTAEMLRDLRTAGLICPAHGGQQPLFPDADAPTVMERLMGADDHV